MTEREDELAWRERMLDEKERSLKAAAETIQKGLEYLQTHVRQMSANIEAEHNKLQRVG
jgi:hypothetical protein